MAEAYRLLDEQAEKAGRENPAISDEPIGSSPRVLREFAAAVAENRLDRLGRAWVAEQLNRHANLMEGLASPPCGRVHASEELIRAARNVVRSWAKEGDCDEEYMRDLNDAVEATDPRRTSPAPEKEGKCADPSCGCPASKAVEETPSEMPTSNDWEALAKSPSIEPGIATTIGWQFRIVALARRMATGEIQAVRRDDHLYGCVQTVNGMREQIDTLRRERDAARTLGERHYQSMHAVAQERDTLRRERDQAVNRVRDMMSIIEDVAVDARAFLKAKS
jgi:hypothetical protein